jgi:hypothetical protein
MKTKKGPGSVLSVLRVFPCTDKSARIDQCTQSPLYVSMCGRHVTLGGKERKNAQSQSHVTGRLLLSIWMFGGTFQMTYYTILRYVARCVVQA